MQKYQLEFIEFAIRHEVLCFGEFILKSGRKSPYFFNSALFNNGASLARLGRFYATAIQNSNIEYDGLFGPAYKGIPLVSTVAVALANDYHITVPYGFNRKEAKDHGEKGTVLGMVPQGKIMVIDDVISAGTSVRLAANILGQTGAKISGVTVALDRQERGTGRSPAVQEIKYQHQAEVVSIVTLDNIIQYLENVPKGSLPGIDKNIENMKQYRRIYGIG